jgi:ABC-type transport system substrate-binding protein
MWVGRSVLALLGAAAAIVAAAGCGSDSSGESSTAATPTEVSIQSPTSPIPTTTAATTTTAAGGNKNPAGTTTTTGGSAPCTVPDAFQDFKFTGTDCSTAVAIAQAWDQNGKACNTIDNPNSPSGYKRTCSVEGFSCEAKRDIHSDGRFVTCTQGGQAVRFTWLPA